MKYIFESASGTRTDEGKTFDTPEEALQHLLAVAQHSKFHSDGKLLSTNVSETSTSFTVEEYNPLSMFGQESRRVNTYTIRPLNKEDNSLIQRFKELNPGF